MRPGANVPVNRDEESAPDRPQCRPQRGQIRFPFSTRTGQRVPEQLPPACDQHNHADMMGQTMRVLTVGVLRVSSSGFDSCVRLTPSSADLSRTPPVWLAGWRAGQHYGDPHSCITSPPMHVSLPSILADSGPATRLPAFLKLPFLLCLHHTKHASSREEK